MGNALMQGHRLQGNLCHADKRVTADPGLAAEELVQAAAVSSKVDHQHFGDFSAPSECEGRKPSDFSTPSESRKPKERRITT